MSGDRNDGLRVALIGCGAIGRRRARVVARPMAGKLVVAVDRDLARAHRVAEDVGCEADTDWHAAVGREDVDAVIVSTTHDVLAAIAIAALRNGKHVLVEKPMARTPAEAEAVVREAASPGGGRAADRRPLVLKVGFNHRHHAAVAGAHEALRRGDLGEPFFIRCRYGHGGRPGYEREWRTVPEIAGGGELLDQGIHALDLFRWFLGDFVEGVGFAPTYFWRSEGDRLTRRDTVEDNAFGLFRTATAQVATLHVSWTQWKNLFSFEIFGRDGYAIVDGLGGSYGAERLTLGRRLPASGPPEEQRAEFSGPDTSWEQEWQEFLAAIHEERQPLGSAHDAHEALKMVHAIYESQRTGALVRLIPA
ncbi:MAG TPA: Gfo/Idh/MocA family oxidoreductase [bacterium]|nr:Gfo/Idh/MocA family oxidoreductase [bacterium]